MFAFNGCNVTINASNSATNKTVFNATNNNLRAVGGIFYIGNDEKLIETVDITLGAGVELVLDGVAPKQSFIGGRNATPIFTFTDYGAVYKATAAALKVATTGISLANFNDGWAWHINGAIDSDNLYTDTLATADVVFQNLQNFVYTELSSGKRIYYRDLDKAAEGLDALYDAVTDTTLTDDALWKAAGSPIIYVSKDATFAATADDAHVRPDWWQEAFTQHGSAIRTVYIKGVKSAEGDNPLVTYTGAGAFIRYNAYFNLTLEDIDLNCTQGLALFWSGYTGNKNSAKSTTTLENCNITATGTSGEGLVFKVTGNKKTDSVTENYTINLINTDVTAKKGVNAVFLFHHGAAGTLNIDGDSSIYHHMEKNADGGDTMFMVGTPRWLKVNIESGAKLTSNVVSGWVSEGAAQWDYTIFNIEGSNTYDSDLPKLELNIEDGVDVTINYADGNTFARPAYFVRNGLSDTSTRKAILNIADGVNFKFNANAAVKGFGIVKGIYETEDNLLGYLVTTADGITKLYDSVVLANKVTQAVTSMVPVYYADGDFAMQYGAALRTVLNESGIRFSNNVATSLVDKLADAKSVTYGTIIAKNELRGDAEITLDTLNQTVGDAPVAVNVIHKNGKVDDKGEYLVNRAALIGVPDTAEAYQIKFAARSYITIEYADGTTKTIYTDFSGDNVRSMLDVADALDGQCGENSQKAVDQIYEIMNKAATV